MKLEYLYFRSQTDDVNANWTAPAVVMTLSTPKSRIFVFHEMLFLLSHFGDWQINAHGTGSTWGDCIISCCIVLDDRVWCKCGESSRTAPRSCKGVWPGP